MPREAGVRFHVDAVQAAGKVPIEVDSIGCQLLSISGHKMHGPQGTGALFVRRGTRLEPLFAGRRPRTAATGRHGECRRDRGFGQGSGVRDEDSEAPARMRALRDRLEMGLLEYASGVNGGEAPRVPNTSNLWFDSLDGEALVIALDLKGSGRVEWRGVLLRRQRTLSCAGSDGSLREPGTQQRALQPAPADDRGRD